MSSPALSPELSEKNKKYDRQLRWVKVDMSLHVMVKEKRLTKFLCYWYRLWGEHGQALLEGAQLCLINVTALGTEILKNIVLPGIGGFTIVDSGVVTEEDTGCK